MPREPTPGDRPIQTGLVFGHRALVLIQERRIDQLDKDAAVLDRLDRARDLDRLARCDVRIGVRAGLDEFHSCAFFLPVQCCRYAGSVAKHPELAGVQKPAHKPTLKYVYGYRWNATILR